MIEERAIFVPFRPFRLFGMTVRFTPSHNNSHNFQTIHWNDKHPRFPLSLLTLTITFDSLNNGSY